MSKNSEQAKKKPAESMRRTGKQTGERQAAQQDSALPPASDLHFHYSREKRLALSTAPGQRARSTPKKGFLKKNIFLFIILIDLLLVSVIVLFHRGVIPLPFDSQPYRLEKGGYSFFLRAFELKDKLIASLTIKKIAEQTEVTGFIDIRFSSNKEVLSNTVELPAVTNENQEIVVTFYEWDNTQPLKAEITLGKDVFILSRKIVND